MDEITDESAHGGDRSTASSEEWSAATYNDLLKLPSEAESDALSVSTRKRGGPRRGGGAVPRPPRIHPYDRNISDVSFSFDSRGDGASEGDCAGGGEDDALRDDPDELLDGYGNRDLEALRDAVEEAISDVEDVMSLALTRALTEEPGGASGGGVPRDGAMSGDGGVTEASCLREAYRWAEEHGEDSTCLDSRNECFQEILNKIVAAVMRNTISPPKGAFVAHECAAIVGLDLRRQLPATTLVITGMSETNDLVRGRNGLAKVFKKFGAIEETAIAPDDRGFGFVRFANPDSLQRALGEHQESKILIQDVPVSIKMLKSSERPPSWSAWCGYD